LIVAHTGALNCKTTGASIEVYIGKRESPRAPLVKYADGARGDKLITRCLIGSLAAGQWRFDRKKKSHSIAAQIAKLIMNRENRERFID